MIGINPFDQPNVQEAKDRTNQILSGQAAPEPSGAGGPEALSSLIASIRPRDYFAITAYLPSTAANEDRLARIRLPVRDGKRVATTVGFGPRFLHSTGQFHKGGPDTGVFLQITESPRERVPIPGRPYGFDRVVAAQAAGDLAALRSRQRRALSISLGADPAAELAPDHRRVRPGVVDRVEVLGEAAHPDGVAGLQGGEPGAKPRHVPRHRVMIRTHEHRDLIADRAGRQLATDRRPDPRQPVSRLREVDGAVVAAGGEVMDQQAIAARRFPIES